MTSSRSTNNSAEFLDTSRFPIHLPLMLNSLITSGLDLRISLKVRSNMSHVIFPVLPEIYPHCEHQVSSESEPPSSDFVGFYQSCSLSMLVFHKTPYYRPSFLFHLLTIFYSIHSIQSTQLPIIPYSTVPHPIAIFATAMSSVDCRISILNTSPEVSVITLIPMV